MTWCAACGFENREGRKFCADWMGATVHAERLAKELAGKTE